MPDKTSRWPSAGTRRAIAAAVPVSMVNVVAFIGQFAYIQAHVHLLPAGAGHPLVLGSQILVAMTFESVAIWLAYMAHAATMADDSAAGTRIAAYAFALVMGTMNYSHYAGRDWRPTVIAVGMALMSAASPWLWGVHTKRVSREHLASLGLIEKHAVRLGSARWTWHMIRSLRVMYWATWHGINDPKAAIAHFESRYGTKDTPAAPRSGRSGRNAPPVIAGAVPEWPALHAVPDVPLQAVPEPAAPVVPALVPGAVPATGLQAEAVPAFQDAPPEPAIAPDAPAARLEARATLSGSRPSQDVIDQVEEALAAMTVVDVMALSERKISRLLGHPDNFRRLAKKMRNARVAAEMQRLDVVPASPSHHPRHGSGFIAPPAGFQPGGIS